MNSENAALNESLNVYFTKAFSKYRHFFQEITTVDTMAINSKYKYSHYLFEFTNFTIIPNTLFFKQHCKLLKEIGAIWIDCYLKRLFKLKISANSHLVYQISLKLNKKWEELILKIEEFYLNYKITCPKCTKKLEYKENCNIMGVLLTHDCQQIVNQRINHECPCGTKFKKHTSYLNHILPVPALDTDELPVAPCAIATFYWIYLSNSTKIDGYFYCTICNNNKRSDGKPRVRTNSELMVYFDFFSWYNHLGFECSNFIKQNITSDNINCYFCNTVITKYNKSIKNAENLNLTQNQIDDLLNCLNTDFNLTNFNLNNFFEFCMDFNLSQKLRPSDLLSNYKWSPVFKFDENDFIKIDQLFLNFPYSCQKCFTRFKDVSLKFNHTCEVNFGKKYQLNKHTCKCGKYFLEHSMYWEHALDDCFLLTFLHFIIFFFAKKYTIISCFCKQFDTDYNTLADLLVHWKTCDIAYNSLEESCRNCCKIECTLNNNNTIERNQSLLRNQCLYNRNNILQSSASVVAKRCLEFTDHPKIIKRPSQFSKIQHAHVTNATIDEKAALIQPIYHLQHHPIPLIQNIEKINLERVKIKEPIPKILAEPVTSYEPLTPKDDTHIDEYLDRLMNDYFYQCDTLINEDHETHNKSNSNYTIDKKPKNCLYPILQWLLDCFKITKNKNESTEFSYIDYFDDTKNKEKIVHKNLVYYINLWKNKIFCQCSKYRQTNNPVINLLNIVTKPKIIDTNVEVNHKHLEMYYLEPIIANVNSDKASQVYGGDIELIESSADALINDDYGDVVSNNESSSSDSLAVEIQKIMNGRIDVCDYQYDDS